MTLLMILLVPYALVSTGVIAWLLWTHPRKPPHPLEWLIDQQPADGGPKQIKHDLPLTEKQKTSLRQPIEVGGVVEVTPLSIELAPAGDQIVLGLKVRNISQDLRFNPLPQSFLVPMGYTFLEFGTHRIYGGRLAWQRAGSLRQRLRARLREAEEGPFAGVLLPGEEMLVTLTTSPRDEATVRKIVDHRGLLLWRLEVRRGLVEVRGQPLSATAVIGIEFDVGVLLRDHRELVGLFPSPLARHANLRGQVILQSIQGELQLAEKRQVAVGRRRHLAHDSAALHGRRLLLPLRLPEVLGRRLRHPQPRCRRRHV
jgi:hypothetical protein